MMLVFELMWKWSFFCVKLKSLRNISFIVMMMMLRMWVIRLFYCSRNMLMVLLSMV